MMAAWGRVLSQDLCARAQIKRKAPNAHTILEVVRLRWGKAAHLVCACTFNMCFLAFTVKMLWHVT